MAKSQASPLVTEWPASEKANLESRLKEGAVVVAYAGCEMHLLLQCKAGGSYHWRKTTLSEDAIEIRNQDDLYAKLPLGAAALESELASSGRLAVHTTVAGQLKLDGVATADIPTTGDCAGATHVISGLSVGTFKLLAGGAASASAGARVGGVEAGGHTTAEEILVRKAGDPLKCAEATDEQPNPDCQSPIQVFLWPLPARGDASVTDASGFGPPGALRVSFVLPAADEKWRAMNGQTVLCDLPCSQWVVPGTEISLRRDGAKASETTTIVMPKDLGGYSVGRSIDAVPETADNTAVGLGLPATLVGGTGTLIGAILWGIGASSDSSAPNNASGVEKPGMITTLVAVPLLATGIVLLATSTYADGVELSLSPEQSAANNRPGVRVASGGIVLQSAAGPRATVSPGGVFGSF